VNSETSVASVSFEVDGDDPFAESRLEERMTTEGPGFLDAVQEALDWVPLVSGPDRPRFEPVALQKDVVRLRRFFRSQGFPRAEVDYRVTLDTAENRVDVVMEVEPGPPRTLDSLVVHTPGDPPLVLEVEALERRLQQMATGPLGDAKVEMLRDRSVGWARRRGFPFARAEASLAGPDSLRPRLEVDLDPGPSAVVGEILVEDGLSLNAETLRKQLLLAPGDTFSSSRLDRSAQQLLDLNLVELALVERVPGQPRDSTVDIRVRLRESDRHLVSGRGGYSDTRGVLTELEWADRNFLGGARTLRATALAETGAGAVGDLDRERYGASLSMEQPWLGDPRVSGIGSVYLNYIDGPREESRSVGGDLTAIWRRGPRRFLSLRYGIQVRDVINTRGAGSGEVGILDILRDAQGLDGSVRRTSLTLSAGWGRRDDPARAVRGWSVNASLTGAGPDGWSDVQYLRGDLSAAWLRPIGAGGLRLLLRGRAGRLLPLGRSRPGDDPLATFLRLGDAVFVEGGTQRVRGWEDAALGPKLPDLSVTEAGDSIQAFNADRYVPLGGLARLGASVEVQLPLPFLSDTYGLVFLDGGRVWTPDDDFVGEDGLPALGTDDTFRFGTGAGLAVGTPVGPVRIMVGYKLNPSPLDLRDPASVGQALLVGRDPTTVPENPWRRWRVHLAVGRAF
jgi:outer membrane protein insertion porin family